MILLFRLGRLLRDVRGRRPSWPRRCSELVLTSREAGKGRRMPMCGIPYHAADRYIARLLAAGYKAAMCEQVEDPKQAKGLVRREVIRILTPGTVVEDHLLEASANNYLVSVASPRRTCGAWRRRTPPPAISWSRRLSGPTAYQDLCDELARLQPAEVLVSEEDEHAPLGGAAGLTAGLAVTTWREHVFGSYSPAEFLMRHFEVSSLRGYGCEEKPVGGEGGGRAGRLPPTHAEVRAGAAAESAHLHPRTVHGRGRGQPAQPGVAGVAARRRTRELAAVGAGPDADADGRAAAPRSG